MSRPIVPVGASTLAWLLRTPYVLGQLDRRVPRLLRGREQLGGTSSSSILAPRRPVHAQHPVHRLAVLQVAGERAHPLAVRADVAYACPVISAVSAPAQARPSSES